MIKDAQILVFDIRLKKLFIMRDNIHNDLSSTLKKKKYEILKHVYCIFKCYFIAIVNPYFHMNGEKLHAVTFCREKLIRKKEALNLFYYALLKYITKVVVLFDAHMNLLGHIHQHLWNSLMINI